MRMTNMTTHISGEAAAALNRSMVDGGAEGEWKSGSVFAVVSWYQEVIIKEGRRSRGRARESERSGGE